MACTLRVQRIGNIFKITKTDSTGTTVVEHELPLGTDLVIGVLSEGPLPTSNLTIKSEA